MLKQANLSFSVAAQSFGDDVTSIQFSTQDRNSAKLIFTIKEGKQPLDLTDVEGKVDLVMGDKSVFDDNKAVVTAPLDGKLEYTITADQIRHPGRARGELQLVKKDGQSIGGFRFNFTIKKALVDEYAGPVKEYYVQDLEAIKAEIRKTADSIKDLDVVRIDSKLNELEQKVEEGGVGVDEQARQEIQEVSAQLADTVKEVNGVKPTNGKITLPIPEIDTSNLATKQELQNIGNASPKGTYATLSALQTAFPTGTTGIYVVQADGKWYFWNSSAWTAGGQYQSTGIPDDSISLVKIQKSPVFKNLLNPSDPDVLIGSYYNSAHVLTTDARFNQSGFIPVTPGHNYTSSQKNIAMHWYGENKNFLSSVGSAAFTNQGYVTAPANAKYARFGFEAMNWSTAQVEQGNSSTSYAPYSRPLSSNIIEDFSMSKIKDLNIKPSDTTFFVGLPKKNLLDPNDTDVLIGAYYDALNALKVNSAFNQSGFIPVIPGADYTSSQRNVTVNFYKEDKTFLSAVNSTVFTNQGYVTAPANAKYARFMFTASNWSTSQVEQGRVPTPFEQYTIAPFIDSQYVKSNNDLESGWGGKTWTSLGDSITFRERWQPTVLTKFGFTHTNQGIGSTCVATKDGYNLDTQAMWRDARINLVKSSNPTLVTIMGGANDWIQEIPIGTNAEFSKPLGSTDTITASDGNTYKNIRTFKGAYSAIIEKLLTWNPKCRIIIISTTWIHESGYAPSNTRLSYKAYSDASRDVAEHYGVPIVNADKEMGLNSLTKSTMLEDSIHPNEYGSKRLAELVIGKLSNIPYVAL